MTHKKIVELWVGLFMVMTFVALMFLALHASGRDSLWRTDSGVKIYADFDNISGLRARAPVRMAGVRVGSVVGLHLNLKTYRARVTLFIDTAHLDLPSDTTASVMTEGLLGSKYVNLVPGFSPDLITEGGLITRTQSAMVLEDLISHFLFSSVEKEAKS